MNKTPFITIADKLDFNTFEREFFIDSFYTQPVLNLKTNTLELKLSLKRTLPFSLFWKISV